MNLPVPWFRFAFTYLFPRPVVSPPSAGSRSGAIDAISSFLSAPPRPSSEAPRLAGTEKPSCLPAPAYPSPQVSQTGME
ncbi:hypothetical protein GX50_04702 [[Emmonsia] crescens]|uniref:Uncharacterized protein n=1 Tax=[Emmonsia] crescens TaxID=73230 RepID=A0A2B7ZH77_9EURO|nr:hypothetical protein GX50_04702 [Emmonsia crescens]